MGDSLLTLPQPLSTDRLSEAVGRSGAVVRLSPYVLAVLFPLAGHGTYSATLYSERDGEITPVVHRGGFPTHASAGAWLLSYIFRLSGVRTRTFSTRILNGDTEVSHG